MWIYTETGDRNRSINSYTYTRNSWQEKSIVWDWAGGITILLQYRLFYQVVVDRLGGGGTAAKRREVLRSFHVQTWALVSVFPPFLVCVWGGGDSTATGKMILTQFSLRIWTKLPANVFNRRWAQDITNYATIDIQLRMPAKQQSFGIVTIFKQQLKEEEERNPVLLHMSFHVSYQITFTVHSLNPDGHQVHTLGHLYPK